MSEVEVHTGKLKKLSIEGKTINEKIYNLLKKYNCKTSININDIDSSSNELSDKLMEDFYDSKLYDEDKFFISKYSKSIYELIDHFEYESGDDIFYHNKDENDNINFVLSFYNGGTCLGEMLDEIIKETENNKKENSNNIDIHTPIYYKSEEVPESLKNEYDEYYTIYYHNTKMKLGICLKYKGKYEYQYGLKLYHADDTIWYDSEKEFHEELDKIFMNENLMWRIYS